MSDPTPELEEKVRLAFARVEPSRVFRGCKIAREEQETIVRVYSHRAGWEKLIPTPYQVFRFDSISGVLTPPSEEEAVRYSIPNYK